MEQGQNSASVHAAVGANIAKLVALLEAPITPAPKFGVTGRDPNCHVLILHDPARLFCSSEGERKPKHCCLVVNLSKGQCYGHGGKSGKKARATPNGGNAAVRVATTTDGINFTDVGAATGLNDPTIVALNGIRYLGSGSIIRLSNGHFGMFFGAGNCAWDIQSAEEKIEPAYQTRREL